MYYTSALSRFKGKKYTIDPEKEVDYIINWIKEQFAMYGENTKAVIGMSGGKDSTIAAALLKEALGPDRVVGVIMPENIMKDKDLAKVICDHLKIKTSIINIGEITERFYDAYCRELYDNDPDADISMVLTNTPARIRMAMLYAVASSCHGRVVDTCNASEIYVGWSTKWGDGAGDFALFHNYPVRYVKMIGYELAKRGVILEHWVDKIPDDGMCGYSDEEKFGFSYDELDDYMINGITPDVDKLTKMKNMNKRGRHKECSIRLDFPKLLTEHEEDKVWVPEIDPW